VFLLFFFPGHERSQVSSANPTAFPTSGFFRVGLFRLPSAPYSRSPAAVWFRGRVFFGTALDPRSGFFPHCSLWKVLVGRPPSFPVFFFFFLPNSLVLVLILLVSVRAEDCFLPRHAVPFFSNFFRVPPSSPTASLFSVRLPRILRYCRVTRNSDRTLCPGYVGGRFSFSSSGYPIPFRPFHLLITLVGTSFGVTEVSLAMYRSSSSLLRVLLPLTPVPTPRFFCFDYHFPS